MQPSNKTGTFVPTSQQPDNGQELRSSLLLCKSCGQTKPKKEFHRVLTLAQSRALLKRPTLKTRHTLYSTLCQSCRQQRKRRTPLSIKEIRTKITTGDIHATLGEAIIKERKQALPRKRSKVMKEYWQKKKTGWQDELKSNLQAQVTRYATRYYSYKTQLPDNPTDRQHAMLEQHSYNYKEAQRIRQDLMKKALSGTNVPTDIKIETQIKRRKVGVA